MHTKKPSSIKLNIETFLVLPVPNDDDRDEKITPL